MTYSEDDGYEYNWSDPSRDTLGRRIPPGSLRRGNLNQLLGGEYYWDAQGNKTEDIHRLFEEEEFWSPYGSLPGVPIDDAFILGALDYNWGVTAQMLDQPALECENVQESFVDEVDHWRFSNNIDRYVYDTSGTLRDYLLENYQRCTEAGPFDHIGGPDFGWARQIVPAEMFAECTGVHADGEKVHLIGRRGIFFGPQCDAWCIGAYAEDGTLLAWDVGGGHDW